MTENELAMILLAMLAKVRSENGQHATMEQAVKDVKLVEETVKTIIARSIENAKAILREMANDAAAAAAVAHTPKSEMN